MTGYLRQGEDTNASTLKTKKNTTQQPIKISESNEGAELTSPICTTYCFFLRFFFAVVDVVVFAVVDIVVFAVGDFRVLRFFAVVDFAVVDFAFFVARGVVKLEDDDDDFRLRPFSGFFFDVAAASSGFFFDVAAARAALTKAS